MTRRCWSPPSSASWQPPRPSTLIPKSEQYTKHAARLNTIDGQLEHNSWFPRPCACNYGNTTRTHHSTITQNKHITLHSFMYMWVCTVYITSMPTHPFVSFVSFWASWRMTYDLFWKL
jgi:hypothetical protein